jgi:hypothetical protein
MFTRSLLPDPHSRRFGDGEPVRDLAAFAARATSAEAFLLWLLDRCEGRP